MKLWDYLKSKMLENPEQTVSEGEVTKTYREVIQFVENFYKKLNGQKCSAIYCRSEMMTGIAVLCCFAAGVTAVPMSQRYGINHCKRIYDFIGPTGVITDHNGRLEVLENEGHNYDEPTQKPCLIMCTSGTTGHPKGAMLSEENILTNVRDVCEYMNISNNDSILISRPVYHCAVLTGELLVSLIKGLRIVFSSDSFNPVSILSLIKDENITVFGATPTVYNMLTRFLRNKGELSLKALVVSGECLAAPIAERLRNAFQRAEIYHVYGLTEASPRVCCLPPALFEQYSDCVGIPLQSVTVEIRDDDFKAVPDGKAGVLWVKGGNVMQGYYKAPELTQKALKDGWLCTGDTAVKLCNGLIKILGRNDDLIISAGMNIYPAEIEALMLSDSRVKEVIVKSKMDENHNTRLIMEVAGDFSESDEVRRICKKLLSSFQMPTEIRLVKELQKNGSGKAVRK